MVVFLFWDVPPIISKHTFINWVHCYFLWNLPQTNFKLCKLDTLVLWYFNVIKFHKNKWLHVLYLSYLFCFTRYAICFIRLFYLYRQGIKYLYFSWFHFTAILPPEQLDQQYIVVLIFINVGFITPVLYLLPFLHFAV